MRSIKDSYRNFLNTKRGINSYHAFKNILYSCQDSLVQTINNDILQHIELVKKGSLAICDIGGGDGKRISKILNYLHSKFQLYFQLDLIEQSKLYTSAFDYACIAECAEVNVFCGLFEEFRPNKRYDIVFLLHSIFAFENGESLNRVLSLSDKKGLILIASNSPNSFLAGLKYLVDSDFEDRRYEINELKEDLSKKQVSYEELTFQTRWSIPETNYDTCIGNILEWISLGSYESFNKTKKRAIFNYIETQTTYSENRWFFAESETVILIPSIEN